MILKQQFCHVLVGLLCIFVSYNRAYKEKYFKQTVDHFSFVNNLTYNQRYLYEDKWWAGPGDPIFFYTGNEGPIDTFLKNTGFMFDIAPKFHALIIFAEHRYYGKSLPFGASKSFQSPYIGYLSIEQALADYATLITHLKSELSATKSPVISFGGSYGGMLSAWFRFKYPNIVVGSIAASAPIFMSSDPTGRDFFFQDVTKDFQAAGCDKLVREAFSEIQILVKSGSTGLQNVSGTFNLCKSLKTTADVTQFYGWIRNTFVTLSMMDYPYPTNFLAKLPAWPVKTACKKLFLSKKNLLKGLSSIVEMTQFNGGKCHDIYTEYVSCADPTGCGLGANSYSWDFQACTEIVLPSGTNNLTDMFPVLPFTLEQRRDYCQKRWNITTDLTRLTTQFWGKDIKSASNVVFSNGDLDPWHRGGVLYNTTDSLVAFRIAEGAHHLDLRSSNPKDPASVIQARKFEISNIEKWIKEFYG